MNAYFMPIAENSKVLNQSEFMMNDSQVLKKLESQTQGSKVLRKLEPKILKSEVLKNSDFKVIESKVRRGSEAKVKTYPRQNVYKQKVWNESKLHYNAKAQSKRKACKINLKGPIRLWVPKNEILFAKDMLKRKGQVTTLVSGQCLLTTYNNKKAYILNLNSEGGRKYGILKKQVRQGY